MNKCITCKNNLTTRYGDDKLGENFCKECFEKYSCAHCNKMNIEIIRNKEQHIIDILVKKKHGTTVSDNSILNTLFEKGYAFQLYCEECWKSQEMYKDEDENMSVEPEEDDLDDDYNGDDEDDDIYDDNYNSYYVGKGKHDLY